jgi:branched-chain amino acid transport system ATP-binding protein
MSLPQALRRSLFSRCSISSTVGLTVLIVEQNVQQVLDVVDRAYLLEVGSIKLAGTSADLKGNDFIRKSYMGL